MVGELLVEGTNNVGPLHAFVLSVVLDEVHLFGGVLFVGVALLGLCLKAFSRFVLFLAAVLMVAVLWLVSGVVTRLFLLVHWTARDVGIDGRVLAVCTAG